MVSKSAHAVQPSCGEPRGADHPSRAGCARGLYPKTQGAFGAAGAVVQFDQTVRNTGEFGADTFDLTVSSAWPTTLYQADGSTPLADTDSDGTPDTGPVAQGDSTTIVVKTALPAGAAAGNSNTAQVTATPSNNPAIVKTARFQTAIPASFAQTYVSQASWMEPSRAMVGFYRPYQQITCQTTRSERMELGRGHRARRQYRPGVEAKPDQRQRPVRSGSSTTRCWTVTAT